MKKTVSIFMALLLCLQVSACAQSNTATYNFPEYNEFVEKMEEKYPKFKIQFSAVSNPSIRYIFISGEIPPEDYYDIFIKFINLFLTSEGYAEFCKRPTENTNPGVSIVQIYFMKGQEHSYFSCTPHPTYEKLGDTSYQGFYNWGIGLADGLSENDNTTVDIWYMDGRFIRKILGSYEEELFDYREYFGFDA